MGIIKTFFEGFECPEFGKWSNLIGNDKFREQRKSLRNYYRYELKVYLGLSFGKWKVIDIKLSK